MKSSRLLFALLAAAAFPLHAQTIFFDGFESPVEEEPAYSCNVDGIMPPGFNVLPSNWTGTFSSPDGTPAANYPNGVSFPTPVGAPRTYMRVVPFVPNPSQIVNLYWDEVQSRPSEGYQPGRPSDGMWFAISPCPGDMRPPNFQAGSFLRPGCRKFERSASLLWTTAVSQLESTYELCKLEAGKTYYLTISPTNVIDGLQVGEHTCFPSDFGCDVGVILGSGVHN